MFVPSIFGVLVLLREWSVPPVDFRAVDSRVLWKFSYIVNKVPEYCTMSESVDSNVVSTPESDHSKLKIRHQTGLWQ